MAHSLDKFKYCPVCGSSRFDIHNEKSKQCADCGFTYYANPSSATVALIVNEKNELLTVRRGKEPAKGTRDLPGGFVDMDETGEQGVAREVLEETGLIVNRSEFLFSYPNLYKYSGMIIHTLDMFFRCYVDDMSAVHAMDDAAGYEWIPLDAIVVDEFGLDSIRIGLHRWLNR
jgi:NADH pyrophosphatase NudC (nudix superfamily)